jgi:hypothetical protein
VWITRLFLFVILVGVCAAGEIHLWTDIQGRQVKATFISLKDDVLVLEVSPGHQLSVSLARISTADQAYARYLAGGGGVVQKPMIENWIMRDTFIGQRMSYAIVARQNPTAYTVTGLPPGVMLNSSTGVISGAPVAYKTQNGVPAPFVLTVSAWNSAGVSEKVMVNWTILPVPSSILGVYSGLVDRHALLNDDLGGSFRMVTSSTGAFSGFLTLGAQNYRFMGVLNITPAGDLAAAQVAISRKSPLSGIQRCPKLVPHNRW